MQNSDNLPMAKTEVKNFGEVELFLCKSASFPSSHIPYNIVHKKCDNSNEFENSIYHQLCHRL